MRGKELLVAVAVACFCAPAIAGEGAAAGKEKFETLCERCHYPDDYAEESESVIEAMILAIMSGETKHRGDFSDLSKEDAANLAAFFAKH